MNNESDRNSRYLPIATCVPGNVMNQLDAVYDSASDSPSEIAKSKFNSLSEHLDREAPEVCRVVARLEARRKESDIQPLVENLQDIVLEWRK